MSDHLGLSSGRLNLFLGGGGELRRLDGQLLGQLAIAHDLNAVIDLLDDAVLDQLDGVTVMPSSNTSRRSTLMAT